MLPQPPLPCRRFVTQINIFPGLLEAPGMAGRHKSQKVNLRDPDVGDHIGKTAESGVLGVDPRSGGVRARNRVRAGMRSGTWAAPVAGPPNPGSGARARPRLRRPATHL